MKFNLSTIENIDTAIFNWIDGLNISCTTQDGWKKIPIIFASPDRAWSSKQDKSAHTEKLLLKYPIISIERGNITKPKNKNALLQGMAFDQKTLNITIPVEKTINHEKTSQRANAKSKRYAGTLNSKKVKTENVIYNLYSIPVPIYTEIEYMLEITTNFIVQMNEILSPILKYSSNKTGFKLVENDHAYECFMSEDFQYTSNFEEFTNEEKEIKYKFNLNVKGYLYHGEENDSLPSVIRSENRPELVFRAETIESGDIK